MTCSAYGRDTIPQAAISNTASAQMMIRPSGPTPPPVFAATGMASNTVIASSTRVADITPRRPFSGSYGRRGAGAGGSAGTVMPAPDR